MIVFPAIFQMFVVSVCKKLRPIQFATTPTPPQLPLPQLRGQILHLPHQAYLHSLLPLPPLALGHKCRPQALPCTWSLSLGTLSSLLCLLPHPGHWCRHLSSSQPSQSQTASPRWSPLRGRAETSSCSSCRT